MIGDALHVANWQRANHGVKPSRQTPQPQPIERPGIAPPANERRFGRPQPIAAIRERLRRLSERT